VDDYLTKPFSDETLLATIRGKLKRFRKLTQMATKKK
jgi:DNA-binding response OmpR family regulator